MSIYFQLALIVSNWCSIGFNLLSIDLQLISMYFQLSVDVQITLKLFQSDSNLLLIGVQLVSIYFQLKSIYFNIDVRLMSIYFQ